MKASELRIGNYVRLEDMCGFNFHVLDEVPKQEDELYRWIEPIPLTEEWLLKFGFKYTKMEVGFNQFLKGILELSITPNGYELFFTYKWVKLEYVHQLQNLYFALTNEELTYESK